MSKEHNIAVICGNFHRELIEQMLAEVRSKANSLQLNIVREVWVPGSFEVPLVLKDVLADKNIAGAVLLGIIEKGETAHGLVMAQAVFTAVINLQLDYGKPVGIGIIGPEATPDAINPRLLPYARGAVTALSAMLARDILKR